MYYTPMYNPRNEKIVATIEARMTSSRLPGKVLLPIGGMPVLEMMINRLKRSRYLDGICIATTTNKNDDPVEELGRRLEVDVFRGSESDVLGRVVGAAQSVGADIVVEAMADSPFVDPELVDRGIEEFFTHDVDYAANCIKDTYAVGFEVQVFPVKVLAETATLTDDIVDRTHVTYYIYKHPEKYQVYNWEAPQELVAPKFRMTLDEESDYRAICTVAEALLPEHPNFTVADVTNYLRAHPEVVAINNNVRQKEAREL